MPTEPINTPGMPLPPWLMGVLSAVATAAIAWGGIGARITNLEAATVRIESKVDALLLKQGK